MIRFCSVGGIKAQGFSLLELMVVLCISAILVTLAVPSFSNIIMRATLASQARELMAGAIMARSEAIKRNQVITLCASSNSSSCTDDDWAKGWIVMTFDDQVLYQHKPLRDGFLINSNVTRVNFNASGVGATMANLIVCRSEPVGSQERVVTISATGRPAVTTTKEGVCAR